MPEKSALLVIDIQNDFLPGGSLAAPDGDTIIPNVISLINTNHYNWDTIVFTQDWHPKDHTSFASNHADVKPFQKIPFKSPKKGEEDKPERLETVWPNHCVQHTHGADFPDTLTECYRGISVPKTIIQKGKLQDRDYYSAFNDIWHDDSTELDAFLRENDIKNVYVVGIAYDFCVKYTCESAAKLGYNTYVIKPLTRAIDLDGIKENDEYLRNKGVTIIEDVSDEKLAHLRK
ncbi:hypothetical protein WICPIJ_007940 [Wickerhamomyces pijperi]|uniref:nicotinamidase n=1 Tax=Wickerhamomyces pijperi TaxID=599730 RepID=A0A9P8TIS5_WICPI|nr:hypothetical protein WICPIJ_007940 [Wickerhamomyces pijperi]